MREPWWAVGLLTLALAPPLRAESVETPPTRELVAGARTDQKRIGRSITAAIRRAKGDPRVIVSLLPREVTAGHGAEFTDLLALRPGRTREEGAGAAEVVARRALRKQIADRTAQFAAGESAEDLERRVMAAAAAADSATPALFQGHFLHEELRPPYGAFRPNCENHWCIPDLTIGDYDRTDLDGRPGNYCSIVPDLWFRWPCYQHDIGYAFAPRAADTKLGSFLAINWKWYEDMRTECRERLRFDWANPEFVACQVVALTYYVFVNTFSYPIFDEPNRITGYDVLDGPEPDPAHPPVFRRWQACTGRYTQSAPFVSLERRVLSGTASVPRGGMLELSGRTHRGTAILFEVWDAAGVLVANHLTEPAGANCLVAQEGERFDTASLSSGTYRITARYYAWESSGSRLDVSYDPPRLVAYGTPTHNESVLTLILTGP